MKYIRLYTILYIIILILINSCSVLSQSNSEYALVRRQVFQNPEIWRLSKGVTNDAWDIALFGNPFASAQSYIMSPEMELFTGMSFSIDHDWDRFIYFEALDNWIRAHGNHGSGANQFLMPRSIDAIAPFNDEYYSNYYFIFVLDSQNDRISEFVYDWQEQVIDINGNIGQGYLTKPIDLDLNNNYNFWPHNDDYLWVLDGYKKLMRFSLEGTLYGTYGDYGCSGGQWEFCNPTAIISGRNWDIPEPNDQYANTTHLYIADPGNNRIAWIIKTTGLETALWYSELQTDPGMHIVDLETDNFGQLWAVDLANDLIIKYTNDLFPLCTFGGTGVGTTEFVSPISISNTGGYYCCGNMFVIESWSDTTGGNYFAIGTDIVDFSVSSIANQNVHYIYFVLIDPSIISVKIYNQNQILVRTLLNGAYLSGEFPIIWNGSDGSGQQLATGDYHLVVNATCNYSSITTGEPVNVVTKEEWIHHVYCYDSDKDGFGDAGYPQNECPLDNCPSVYNPDQEDNDNDGIGNACCCIGMTGNADCSASEDPDISDISRIVDYLYISHRILCCPNEADCNTDGIIDIQDITALTDYLYLTHIPLSQCF
ncbi:MAG: FlgD immunoglobulin-like domain containing protein [candidate division Zixibacteria bacterium]|nr:FlgD immunoglobulin-like domain containing protein [candidate division Zixibacteria bacterium]MDD5426071.1 FlgD immunoglobulin-like domain containing protein [candidate division Zixibacteria bacterium]